MKKMSELILMKEVSAMEVIKIRVGGFKNISDLTLYFDSITALVGLNGYGKSNVMDAIDFGFDFIHYSSEARKKIMTSKKSIPILKVNAGKDFQFEIEAKVKSNEKVYFINYGYSFSWGTEKKPAYIKREFLNIKDDGKNQKYNAYVVRDENGAKIKTSESGRCSKKVDIEGNSLVLTKLLALDELYYLDILKKIYSSKYFIERHLDAGPSFTPAPFVIKGFQELELQGIQSIPRAIYYLKRDYQEKYQLLVDAFKQLFPEVKDVRVKEIQLNRDEQLSFDEDAPFVFTDSIYSMSIVDEKMVQPVRFESLSDGTKRIFLMLTYAIIADVKGLSMIAIEEPENSIHPGMLQSYIDVLKQLVNDCKIIITSHSPYMLQYVNPRDIYVGMTNDAGEAQFRRIASSKVNALLRDAAEYSQSAGDYIFSLLALPDSEEYLKEYVERNVR